MLTVYLRAFSDLVYSKFDLSDVEILDIAGQIDGLLMMMEDYFERSIPKVGVK